MLGDVDRYEVEVEPGLTLNICGWGERNCCGCGGRDWSGRVELPPPFDDEPRSTSAGAGAGEGEGRRRSLGATGAAGETGRGGRSLSLSPDVFFSILTTKPFSSGLRVLPRSWARSHIPLSLACASRARFMLVGSSPPALPREALAPGLKAPCSYFFRIYFSISESRSAVDDDVGGGLRRSSGLYIALDAVLPTDRRCATAGRSHESSVMLFLPGNVSSVDSSEIAKREEKLTLWTCVYPTSYGSTRTIRRA